MGSSGIIVSGCARRLQIAILIRQPHHRIRVADINPLRIGAYRVKGDPERTLQASGEGGNLLGLAVRCPAAENLDLSRRAVRHEEVAIRRHAHLPRLGQPFMDVELHLEPSGRHRPHVVRLRHHLGKIRARLGVVRLRKVGGRDFVEQPRLFLLIIGEGLLARHQILRVEFIALPSGAFQHPASAGKNDQYGEDHPVHLFHFCLQRHPSPATVSRDATAYYISRI